MHPEGIRLDEVQRTLPRGPGRFWAHPLLDRKGWRIVQDTDSAADVRPFRACSPKFLILYRPLELEPLFPP